MLPSPYPAPVGAAYLESRIATHDGYIWPVERQEMLSAGAIRERMLEDINALVNDGGEDAVVTLTDLSGKGWSSQQVATHGQAAFARYRSESELPLRRSGGTVIRAATDAACIVTFACSLLFWAGVGSGAI